MSQRDWRLYAQDILLACDKIRRFVAGKSWEAFQADDLRQDAVMRNIEIIGEASAHLPKEVTATVPEVPWRLVIGMRNILAHAYFGVSLEIIWDAAITQVAPIEAAVRKILEQEPTP